MVDTLEPNFLRSSPKPNTNLFTKGQVLKVAHHTLWGDSLAGWLAVKAGNRWGGGAGGGHFVVFLWEIPKYISTN